jgi:hypothetical protein
MIIHNPILTGSFTVNGTDVANITSSADSIASLNAYTASQNNLNATYATTGSNTLIGTQVVSGSILTSGSITATGILTAQTLVVQTITSSVDFVTGSTRFGSVVGNTHQFTGSMGISGSVAVVGSLSGTGATFTSPMAIGAGTQAINGDAELTLREGVAFVGLDFQGARTSGNLGGIRFYNTSSTTDAIAQLLIEVDGKFSFYNNNNANPRFTIASTGAATFSSSVTAATNFIAQSSTTNSLRFLYENTYNKGGISIDYTTGEFRLYAGESGNGYYQTFFTQGSERMRITSGGNVVVNTSGTSAPLSGQLVNKQKSDTTTPYINGIVNMANGSSKNLAIWYDGNNNVHNISATYYTGGDGGAFAPLAFQTSDAERMRITSGGNVLIGTTTESARLAINASSITGIRIDSGSDVNALSIGGSGAFSVDYPGVGGGRFLIANNGVIFMPMLVSAYTTAQGANMYVNPADGAISRSTSSIKYKNSVTNYDKGLSIVNQLRPVYYKGNNDGDKIFAGLIAEEVHELGLTEYVQYAEDGSPDALSYQNMVALLIKSIQEQQAQIEILKQEIETLKAN